MSAGKDFERNCPRMFSIEITASAEETFLKIKNVKNNGNFTNKQQGSELGKNMASVVVVLVMEV